MLPNEGSHSAKLNGQIVVYETPAGALCLAIPVRLDSDVAWAGKSTQTLVKQDGTVNTRCYDDMKRIFGDPMEPGNPIYRFEDVAETPLAEIEGAAEIAFDVTIEHRQSEATDDREPVTYASIKWLNPSGGGVKMPEPVSRKDVLAKYGSKFKALSGGAKAKTTPAAAAKAVVSQPAAKATPPKAAAPAAKSPPGKRKADDPLAPTASQDEAWGALVAKASELTEDNQGAVWYAEIEKMFPGKTGDLSLKEYGALKVLFESDEYVVEVPAE